MPISICLLHLARDLFKHSFSIHIILNSIEMEAYQIGESVTIILLSISVIFHVIEVRWGSKILVSLLLVIANTSPRKIYFLSKRISKLEIRMKNSEIVWLGLREWALEAAYVGWTRSAVGSSLVICEHGPTTLLQTLAGLVTPMKRYKKVSMSGFQFCQRLSQGVNSMLFLAGWRTPI